MKKYKIKDMENIFRFADITTIHIEKLRFDVVNKKELAKIGKRKKDATEGELDLLAKIDKVIWLVEFSSEKWGSKNNVSVTYDFDNFKSKIELLNSNRNLLGKFIEKIKQKFNEEIKIDLNQAKIIGLYVNTTFTPTQCMTIEQRIPPKNKKQIYVWDCDTFEYFKVVSNTLRKFSRYEIFAYFDISPKLVFSPWQLELRTSSKPYEAIKIEKGVFGHPVYTFKITPRALLERCYVLRNEGWRSDSFQRMVMPKKLRNVREYIIKAKNTSFANNIIISPSAEIPSENLIETPNQGKILINLPNRFSSFSIIDGQHRLLAFTQNFYGEYDEKEIENDETIKKLTEKSEIIATLVSFSGEREDILRQQAQLFKDINSTQSRVKSDFIYNLQEIINPSHAESIANKIIRYLNNLDAGVFKDKFEIKSLPSYKGRIKRSSIVKWGLSELVNLDRQFYSSLYKKNKGTISDLEDYIIFCGNKLEKYFRCIKDVFGKKYKKPAWDHWRKSGYMLLSTSAIVGFLRLYRHFIKDGLTNNEEEIKKRLETIRVHFKKENYIYTSSQWAKLETAMFDQIIKKFPNFGDESLVKRD